MLEEVCNILNKGEVPNLFEVDEKQKIINEMESSVNGTPSEKF